MCGIAGIFEFDLSARPDLRLLKRMTNAISHRGPDDDGHTVLDNVALGHRRLSIIDLSASGHQPMSNDNCTIWIVYNGECYNYLSLRDRLAGRGVKFHSTSDTEVVLRMYEEYGEEFLNDIDGMFALAIWDRRRKEMIIARDRIGIKPLFYTSDRRRLLFASEMKSLLCDPAVPTEINKAALGDYLHLLSIPDPNCIFAGVHKLQPGRYLRVTPGGIKQKKYWELGIDIDPEMSFEAACDGFTERFYQSVSSHMIGDVPIGTFLSGGVDSSAIVADARRTTNLPIETFSITFPGLAEFDESGYASAVAAHCGTHHHEFKLTPKLIKSLPRIVWHADEPFAISSAFALYHLAEFARRHVKVVLSGDGGDEVFGGYVWRHANFAVLPSVAESILTRVAETLVHRPTLHRLLPSAFWERLRRFQRKDQSYVRSSLVFHDAELTELLEPGLAASVQQAWDNNVVQRYLDTAPGSEQLARKLYTDVKTTLVSEMLTKADRMTMAHGLEVRVPFLDHHLVEWAFTVPGIHKLRDRSGKLLVKKAMEPFLPHDILYRRKQGFNVPLKLWMRDDLREFVRDNLSGTHIRRRGHFCPSAVEKILKNHFAGTEELLEQDFHYDDARALVSDVCGQAHKSCPRRCRSDGGPA